MVSWRKLSVYCWYQFKMCYNSLYFLAHPATLIHGIFAQKWASQAGLARFRSLLLSLVCEILLVCIRSAIALDRNWNKFFVRAALHAEQGCIESVFAFWVPLLLKGIRSIEKGFHKNGKKSEKSLLSIMSQIVLLCGTPINWWDYTVLYLTHINTSGPECFNLAQLICWIIFSENLGNCHLDICIKHAWAKFLTHSKDIVLMSLRNYYIMPSNFCLQHLTINCTRHHYEAVWIMLADVSISQ